MMDSSSSSPSAQTPAQASAQSKSRWTPDSPHRALRLALASASLLSLAAGAPIAASAAGAVPVIDQSAAASAPTSGVYVTILSPNPGMSLAGKKQVEIRAYYESSFGVSGLDLYIDGQHMATQQLAKPEERGEISFVVEASALRAGAHSIVIRATATDQEVSSARTEMSLPAAPSASVPDDASGGGGGELNAETAGGPSVGIVSPGPSATVGGIIEIKVDASDASGKAPYVSLFVDHQFKTLRNFAPYTFDLDTNHLTNGKHTIEIWGYNDAQERTQAKPLEIIVNNPGGHTFERHDLLDDAPSAPKSHTTRGGAVISSRPPAATHTPTRAPIAATALITHKATAKGVPSIAHTARKAMSQMIAKADKLASLGASTAELDSVGQNGLPSASTIAPAFTPRGISTDTFETRTFAAPTAPQAIIRSHSVVRSLHGSQVPALRGAHGAPVIASLNPGSRSALSLIKSAGKLETAPGGSLDTGSDGASMMPDASVSMMPQITAPESLGQLKAKIQAPSVYKAAKPMPAPVQIASSNLEPSSVDEAKAGVLKAITTAAPQKAADKSRAKAAARKDIIKPMNAKKSAVVAHIPAIALADFRPHDIAALRGVAEVVVNDQSVDLNQPLQDRGAMLFAPIRQIIEQQGGTLSWNSETRQVSAVDGEAVGDGDNRLTHGQRKQPGGEAEFRAVPLQRPHDAAAGFLPEGFEREGQLRQRDRAFADSEQVGNLSGLSGHLPCREGKLYGQDLSAI